MDMWLNECRIITLPQFTDDRGTLSAIEGPPLLPFNPKRFYYIYGVPEGALRGCHAHRTEQELILALAGSFQVLVDDGETTMDFHLDTPSRGLYIPPLIWHELHSFAAGSVCAVLASGLYNAADYYPSYQDFLQAVRK